MPTQKRALVIIDAQVGLLDGEPSIYRKEELLRVVNTLRTWARQNAFPIVYVMDDDIGQGNTNAHAIHEAIEPIEGDVVVHKTSTSGFFRTSLHEELSSRGIQHIVVVGCKTEFCVDTTCRHAIGLGYDVTLVADGHSTTHNGILTAEQIVAHHNRNLDGLDNHEFMIRVQPARSVVDVLE